MPPENEDRGDDFVPTEDDGDGAAAAAAVAAADAAKKLEDDLAAEKAAEKAAEEEAAEKESDKSDEKKVKIKDARIPLSRHEDILAKEREKRADVERQLAQFQNGEAVREVNAEITAHEDKILKLEKDYAQELTDGNIDKATAIMGQIRKAEREMAESKSDMKIQAAEIRAVERTRYGTTLERIEASFPVLNPDHAEFDEAVMDEVAELKSAYELKGLTPTAALQKAVRLIVGAETTRQEIATTATARVTPKDVAAERKKAAVAKTVDTVTKTPPSTRDVGLDSDKLGGGKLDAKAAAKMSQDEFRKLSEADLALMRGDVL